MPVGIENLKIVAKAGVELFQKLSTVFDDNKITLAEAFGFFPVLMGIPDILKNKVEIKEEWKNLDSAKRADIKAYVASELSLPNNPGLERKIEKGIGLMLDLLDFASEFKKPAA